MKINSHKVLKVTSLLVGGVILVFALYIMANQLGLSDELDFGAGAYFYADIPNYHEIDNGHLYTSKVPRWVHFVLFFVWGAFVYWLWTWIDKKGNQDNKKGGKDQ